MNNDLASPVLRASAIDDKGLIHYKCEGGLTKRETAAIACLQGLLSDRQTSAGYTTVDLAEFAVLYADALLLQLGAKNDNT